MFQVFAEAYLHHLLFVSDRLDGGSSLAGRDLGSCSPIFESANPSVLYLKVLDPSLNLHLI